MQVNFVVTEIHLSIFLTETWTCGDPCMCVYWASMCLMDLFFWFFFCSSSGTECLLCSSLQSTLTSVDKAYKQTILEKERVIRLLGNAHHDDFATFNILCSTFIWPLNCFVSLIHFTWKGVSALLVAGSSSCAFLFYISVIVLRKPPKYFVYHLV